jgi:hypothetical protein
MRLPSRTIKVKLNFLFKTEIWLQVNGFPLFGPFIVDSVRIKRKEQSDEKGETVRYSLPGRLDDRLKVVTISEFGSNNKAVDF